jgi:hypothetical protein
MALEVEQNALPVVQQLTGWFTISGGLMAWAAQNATVISMMTGLVTGVIFAVCAWANKKSNRRNAIANEKRNEINERDITYAIIKKLEKEGLCDEAQKIRDSLNK